MKPLNKNTIDDFLERFEYFKDGEVRKIEITSPSSLRLIFGVQDSSRGYDWVSLKLEYNDVSEASLLDDKVLPLVDMSDGVDIKHNGTEFAFNVKNSTCHIKSSSIKYEEGQF